MPKTIKTLDLSVYEQKYLDVVLLDGSIIQLKKPTQKIAIEMASLPQYLFETDLNVIVTALNDVLINILNNNREDRVFTLADVQDWEIELKNAVLEAYQGFLFELQKQDF